MHAKNKLKVKETEEAEGEKGQKGGKSLFPFSWYSHFKPNIGWDMQVRITRSTHKKGFGGEPYHHQSEHRAAPYLAGLDFIL